MGQSTFHMSFVLFLPLPEALSASPSLPRTVLGRLMVVLLGTNSVHPPSCNNYSSTGFELHIDSSFLSVLGNVHVLAVI
jgi:hypothetical protein